MDVQVKGTYSDIIVTDQESICFPSDFTGSIRPGSLDHLTLTESIEWGENMSSPIEPGVIPKCCLRLLLPVSYKHRTDAIKLEAHVDVFISHRNIEYGPTDRVFTVWKEDAYYLPSLPKGLKWSGNMARWVDSPFFGGKRVKSATKIDHRFEKGEFDALLESSKQVHAANPDLYLDSIACKIRNKIKTFAEMGVLAKGFVFQVKGYLNYELRRQMIVRLEKIFPELGFYIAMDISRPWIEVAVRY